jgi:hypothetical protein
VSDEDGSPYAKEGIQPMFVSSTTRIKLSEPPESVSDLRVTLVHPSGKRVDLADKDIELEEDIVEVSGEIAKSYGNLYAEESEEDRFIIEVSWVGEEGTDD